MNSNRPDFRHLILLIGTNPLPNFVVADFFLKHNEHLQKIWLVHSEKNDLQSGTATQADNLEKLLKTRWNAEKQHQSLQFPFEKISLSDVSHAKKIRSDIEEKLDTKLGMGNGKVHLNYTGGTKAMSTHVYWLLKEKLKSDISFSYLDARRFRLLDDDRDEVIAGDLRREVSITFEELIRLHGFERRNKDDNFEFSEALCGFKKMIESGELNCFYAVPGGYNRKLFENHRGELIGNKKDLCQEKIDEFEPNDHFFSIAMSMPEKYRLFTHEKKFNQYIPNKEFKKAVKFFDGLWLEYHIAEILKGISGLSIFQNWEIKKPTWPNNLYFELDVILLKSYQMIGISCTSDITKRICKSKGFEIIHRTRQIGGDESKAILITRLVSDDKEKLQQELIHDTGGEGNILVLGADDLKHDDLLSEIQTFISEEE